MWELVEVEGSRWKSILKIGEVHLVEVHGRRWKFMWEPYRGKKIGISERCWKLWNVWKSAEPCGCSGSRCARMEAVESSKKIMEVPGSLSEWTEARGRFR